MRVHLDTDIGSNPDDVAALAYLLGCRDVEITAVTTVDDPDGRRAGCVEEVLRLAGRSSGGARSVSAGPVGAVPVAAGAPASLTTGRACRAVRSGPEYWPDGCPARPGRPADALDLLSESISAGAVVIGIGPASTLALLERRRPGALRASTVVLMGGSNVTCDPVAAAEVHRAAGTLTLVPATTTEQVGLRADDLGRLEAAGALGALLGRQIRAYRRDGRRYRHHDPVTVAAATGWAGARRDTIEVEGRAADVVVGLDVGAFAERWIATIEGMAQR